MGVTKLRQNETHALAKREIDPSKGAFRQIIWGRCNRCVVPAKSGTGNGVLSIDEAPPFASEYESESMDGAACSTAHHYGSWLRRRQLKY
jgi:hypothetical protein